MMYVIWDLLYISYGISINLRLIIILRKLLYLSIEVFENDNKFEFYY